jgi:hypothetical protein
LLIISKVISARSQRKRAEEKVIIINNFLRKKEPIKGRIFIGKGKNKNINY